MVNENQHIINRKIILYDQRYTNARLAKEIDYTPAAVGLAINGKSKSYKLHRKIADKLGVTLIDFWPELYNCGPKASHDATINDSSI